MSDFDRQAALRQRSKGPVVMRQWWRDLFFVHFPVSPDELQSHLPPGLTVDTHADADGVPQGWIGLVPFRMEGVRPRGLPALPRLSNFAETNVRTYVIGPDGDPGVWFFSLDAANQLACRIARLTFSLPYHFAEMEVRRDGDKVHYRSRRHSDGAFLDLSIELGGAPKEAQTNSFDYYLVERYLLYAHHRGVLHSGRVFHAPYRIQPCRILSLDESLTTQNGLPRNELVHPCFAEGVDVDVYPLKPCRR